MKEISEIVRQFKEIVQATLDGNAKKVALEYGHDKEIPFYNTRITSNGTKCEIVYLAWLHYVVFIQEIAM